MLAGDARDRSASERVRRSVEAQLRRAGVATQDAPDVRTDVVLALPSAPDAELPLPLELVCARAAVIARNKAIDLGRRQARSPVALVADIPEPRPVGERPGSLDDGLDEVAALAHRRRVRADLARALERLDEAQRAAISAHAEGGAAAAAGLPRSTYYRALAHAQARLRSDLRGRLAGLGALGDLARGARELFAHAEAVHAAAAGVTAVAAVGTAVVLSLPGAPPLHLPPTPVEAVGGHAQVSTAVPPARSPAGRAPVAPPSRSGVVTTTSTTSTPLPAAPPAHRSSSCTYDPSSYDC